MKNIRFLFLILLFGISFLGVVSPTTIEKFILYGSETVRVVIKVGDSVPLATGEEAIVTGIRSAQQIAIRIIGGASMFVQIRAISLRRFYTRKKEEEKQEEKKKELPV